MVLILNVNSERAAHVWRKAGLSWMIYTIATVLNLNKCLKQIIFPISLYSYAPISELPSNISVMGWGEVIFPLKVSF